MLNVLIERCSILKLCFIACAFDMAPPILSEVCHTLMASAVRTDSLLTAYSFLYPCISLILNRTAVLYVLYVMQKLCLLALAYVIVN